MFARFPISVSCKIVFVIGDIFENQDCKWCGRKLSESFLTRLTLGIEKADALLFPVLCVCGGITVIGAGTFISHFDELSEKKENRR